MSFINFQSGQDPPFFQTLLGFPSLYQENSNPTACRLQPLTIPAILSSSLPSPSTPPSGQATLWGGSFNLPFKSFANSAWSAFLPLPSLTPHHLRQLLQKGSLWHPFHRAPCKGVLKVCSLWIMKIDLLLSPSKLEATYKMSCTSAATEPCLSVEGMNDHSKGLFHVWPSRWLQSLLRHDDICNHRSWGQRNWNCTNQWAIRSDVHLPLNIVWVSECLRNNLSNFSVHLTLKSLD